MMVKCYHADNVTYDIIIQHEIIYLSTKNIIYYFLQTSKQIMFRYEVPWIKR